MSDTQKVVGLRINGVAISLPFDPLKSSQIYASEFLLAFEPLLPALEFSIAPGGNLVVQAAEGAPLVISSFGTGFVPIVSVKSDKADEAQPVVVVVTSGVAGQTYRVSLNGQAFSYATGTAEEPDTWYVEAVAEALRASIVAGGFIVQRFANVLVIRSSNGSAVRFAVTDTWNNKAILGYRGRVGSESELPPWLDTGTVLAVGDVRYGGKYVKYSYRSGLADGFVEQASVAVNHSGWTAFENTNTGVYEETYLPGTNRYFAEETMPHVLVRESDGTFTFKQADWLPRQVGDIESLPEPSFVGKTINDMFFFKNRMGVLCDDSIVFSKAGQFMDFWGESVSTVLDTDPVDVNIDMARVVPMLYAIPFSNHVLLWGDGAQFVVQATGALTVSTLSVQPSTAFESAQAVRPAHAGASLFFVSEVSAWSKLHEYYVLQDSYQNTARELSSDVPRYIPSGVLDMASSDVGSTVAMLAEDTPDKLFIYQYAWNGEEQTQRAFSHWTFGGEVRAIGFIRHKLYMLMDRVGEGLYLEAIDLQDNTSKTVDRLGHSAYEDYTMLYQFSPVFVRDQYRGTISTGKTKYRTVSVKCGDTNAFQVAAAMPMRGTTWRTFPDYARAAMYDGVKTPRASLSGDTQQTAVFLVNPYREQATFYSVSFELIREERARRV